MKRQLFMALLTANRRSISVLLHSSRLPPTVSTAG